MGTAPSATTSACYVEINTHTIEKRLHTAESLLARLIALKLLPDNTPMLPKLSTIKQWEHGFFRLLDYQDAGQCILPARANGAWGLTTPIPCQRCKGSGGIALKDDVSNTVVACWECNGTGQRRPAKGLPYN